MCVCVCTGACCFEHLEKKEHFGLIDGNWMTIMKMIITIKSAFLEGNYVEI
jgi:hypothetical protein